MDASPVALTPDAANRQHYEVPPELFQLMLGPRLEKSNPVAPGQVVRRHHAGNTRAYHSYALLAHASSRRASR